MATRSASTFIGMGTASLWGIAYDPAKKSYVINFPESGAAVEFSQPDTVNKYAPSKNGENTNYTGDFTNYYLRTSKIDDYISNTSLRFSYLVYGVADSRDYKYSNGPYNIKTNDYRFIAGTPTNPSDVPKSGEYRYNAYTELQTYPEGPAASSRNVSANQTIVANFGTSQIQVKYDLSESLPVGADQNSGWKGSFIGNAPIRENRFDGTLKPIDAPTVDAGRFSGGFFGPKAKELGMVFSINGQPVGKIEGVTVGQCSGC